jgi:DNA-binding response OmpR family regulator
MGHRTHVLVVDDDLDALYYVDDLLAEIGLYPIKATTMADAAEILGAMNVDAVVLNAGMVAAASDETLARLAPVRDTTPVLVMGGPGMQPDGAPSPLRRFLEHPPELTELRQALWTCAALPEQ